MQKSTTLGIDLAKNIIQVSEVKHNKVKSNRNSTPDKFRQFLTNKKPSKIVFEACGSAHYWARQVMDMGHEAIILPAQFVAGSRQGQKTDANDALACAVAGNHPNARAVSIRTEEEQGLQPLARIQQALTKQSTALNNMLTGLLFEFGIKRSKRSGELPRRLPEIPEDAENGFSGFFRDALQETFQDYQVTQQKLTLISARPESIAKEQLTCRKLMALEGVGPINAVGLYLALGDGRSFRNGRDAAACIGVTPKQHSTGGKVKLGHVGKNRGHQRLRYTLFQGAISVAKAIEKRAPQTVKEEWFLNLIARRGMRCAAMAYANKTVRTAWAMISQNTEYKVAASH